MIRIYATLVAIIKSSVLISQTFSAGLTAGPAYNSEYNFTGYSSTASLCLTNNQLVFGLGVVHSLVYGDRFKIEPFNSGTNETAPTTYITGEGTLYRSIDKSHKFPIDNVNDLGLVLSAGYTTNITERLCIIHTLQLQRVSRAASYIGGNAGPMYPSGHVHIVSPF